MDTTFVRNESGLRARLAGLRDAARLRRQKGLTLIEAAMVLGVLAVVVGGIMWVFTATNQNRQTSTALTQLTTIVERVRTLYGGQSSFTGLNNAALIDTQSLPASMVSGTTLRHAFNAAITVATAEAAGGANSGFSVAFAGVPKDACTRMLSLDQGRGNYSAGASTTRTQPNLPFTPPLAAASCNQDYNTVTWIFN